MQKLADVLEGSEGDAIRGMNVLLDKLGVRRSLQSLGMKEGDVENAAGIAMERPYWNPRPVERESLTEVLRRCWAGDEARADL
jgi:alcohol dehydrogenase class IV